MAGPGPSMSRRAVPPSPASAIGPERSSSTSNGAVSRYVPRGKTSRPPPASTACRIASVSSVRPSPTAPKSRTVLIILSPRLAISDATLVASLRQGEFDGVGPAGLDLGGQLRLRIVLLGDELG